MGDDQNYSSQKKKKEWWKLKIKRDIQNPINWLKNTNKLELRDTLLILRALHSYKDAIQLVQPNANEGNGRETRTVVVK